MSGGERVRAALVVTDLEVGGAEKALYELAVRVPREEFQVAVVSLKRPGEVGCWLEACGVPVISAEARGAWDAGAVVRLGSILGRIRPHVVQAFLFHAIVGVALQGRGVAPVRIGSLRVVEQGLARRAVLRWAAARLDALACVSEGVRRFAVRVLNIGSEKLEVIPNGVDVGAFAGAEPVLRGELGVPAGVPLVVSVGRLDEQKGMDDLVRAAASVRARGVRFRMAIVGDGPQAARLKRRSAQLGLADCVQFLGKRSDIESVLASADLFVLASRWEGMPNALLEAMAAARPVVATRVAGSEELVEDGRTGVLVPPRCVEALADAIAEVLGDRMRAGDMGRAGLRRVREHFTIERMAERTVALWRRCLDKA
mgnify:CR=1 FL=1